MKIDTMYIISYLPDDEKIRKRRKKVNHEQIHQWLDNIGISKIVVFAQNYNQSDFYDDSRVEYIVSNSDVILRPGPARNKLLEVAYSSDDDFFVLADDDALVYGGEPKYLLGYDIIRQLRAQYPEEFINIDLIRFHDPSRRPFLEFSVKNENILQEYLYFEYDAYQPGTLYICRNFGKCGTTKHFFPDCHDENGSIIPGEDVMWSLSIANDQGGTYCLRNAFLDHKALKASTWLNKNESRKLDENIKRQYAEEFSIPMNKSRFDWKTFREKRMRSQLILVEKAKL